MSRQYQVGDIISSLSYSNQKFKLKARHPRSDGSSYGDAWWLDTLDGRATMTWLGENQFALVEPVEPLRMDTEVSDA